MLYESDAFKREWEEAFNGVEINEEILLKIWERASINPPSSLRKIYDKVFTLYFSSNNDLDKSIELVLDELVKKEYEINKAIREHMRSI